VVWLLEKLGVVKKESDDLDKNADKAEQRSKSDAGNAAEYQPPGGNFGFSYGYVPVSAGGGRSYTDNSKNSYQISVGAGMGAQDTSRQVIDALDARERQRRAEARARMGHD
jgi:hypothetical protein